MSLPPSKLKILAGVAVLALGLSNGNAAFAAAVETYVDDAVPVASPQARYDSPLRAGEMTLEDVLIGHPAPSRPPPLQPPPPPASAAAAATAATPSLTQQLPSSTANMMLMQGMKSVLQQSGTGGGYLPQPPRMHPTGQPASALASPMLPVAQPVSAPSGVMYQPGQAPVNLATGGTPIEVPVVAMPPAAAPTPTQAPEATKTSADKKAAGCEPHVNAWTKTCVEAGYPASFTGKIAGETHTTCPEGTLQDVWIANSCAAPEEAEESSSSTPSAAPLTAPTSAPALTAPEPSPAPVRIDARCGSANGLAVDSRPAIELCEAGDATEVSGDGPWRWNCKGSLGGMTVSCAATMAAVPTAVPAKAEKTANNSGPPALEDGICSSSDGQGTDHAPAANLCAKGVASRVNGNGPWTWACSGQNGGQAAACNAPKRINGVCGDANSTSADQMPTTDLCSAGLASAVTGSGPWNWTCSGLYGGSAATCAAIAKKDAVCGNASTFGHKETPRDDLCSVGKASSVHGGGPWSWACNGDNGGSSVSCTAPISVNGVCGSANGVAIAQAPSEELCAHGTPTRIAGLGPWSWNCSGADGGETQSCTAPLATQQSGVAAMSASSLSVPDSAAAETQQSSLCGPATELMALAAPEKDLCANGAASAVSGSNGGPWSWTCTDSENHSASCSTLSVAASAASASVKPGAHAPSPASAPPEEVSACGSASGQGTAQTPSEGLCSSGKASTVRGNGPWTWSCYKGKAKIACHAPKLINAVCGPVNGSIQKSIPNRGLCSAGTATDVQGNGPWLWSCVGVGGGASTSCSASSEAQTRIDGSCGAAANTPMASRPEDNLCDSGVHSAVYGAGPWTWTCSGLNGGIAASCTAQKSIPHAPPPPSAAVDGLCGSANGLAMMVQPMDELCTSGTATAVSGSGPWNWNCLGQNGGMTVSCTAPLQPPAPITGVCGQASGAPTLVAPQSGLCAAGISSAVSGRGPWTWSCSGTNGGGAVGCVAPLATAGGIGSLPSLVTAPEEAAAPAPNAAPMAPVTGAGLVTPRLPTGSLPPISTGSLPSMIPSKSFAAPPEPSPMPTAPALNEQGMAAPVVAPDLPENASALPPPPIRDTLKPAPALELSETGQNNLIPGNRFILDEDVSTLAFIHGSENLSPDNLPTLDKLVAVLQSNSGVRITLTAYAPVRDSTPRDARRLSLARALAVRDYLTTRGIASGRVDVRAMGANVSSGDPDRVDVRAN